MTREQLVMVPPAVPAPRGALWAADGVVLARRLTQRLVARQPASSTGAAPGTYRRTTPTLLAIVGHKVWRALAEQGHRRAAAELRRQAQHWQSIDPKIAEQLRQAAEFNPNEEA
jgi:hypothetical protein